MKYNTKKEVNSSVDVHLLYLFFLNMYGISLLIYMHKLFSSS